MVENVIALIYDFDNTLSPFYSQKPLFDSGEFDITEKQFWQAVKEYKKKHNELMPPGQQVDGDIAYLNMFISMSKPGQPLAGLTKDRFIVYGKEIQLFSGLPEFFYNIQEEIEADKNFKKYGIKVEHYIASCGIGEMLRASAVSPHMEMIDASEFIYDENGVPIEIGRLMTDTVKTQVVFNINKGVYHNRRREYLPTTTINANTTVAREQRRVLRKNMGGLGDGPSDTPFLTVITLEIAKEKGGFAMAVYNPNPNDFNVQNKPELVKNPAKEALEMKLAGRVEHINPADYSKDSGLYYEMVALLRRTATRIAEETEWKLSSGMIKSLKHPV